MGRRVTKGLILGIIFLGLFVRVQGLKNPLLDDQAWRQADTASMALNMMGRLMDIPQVFFPYLLYDGIQPQRVELEFPFLPYLLAWVWTIVGWADIYGRIIAIAFSIISIVGIYKLGKLLLSERAAMIATGLYSVLPLSIYYGRVIMPEPVAQMFTIWALYFAANSKLKNSLWNILFAGLFMAGAVLAKLPQLMIFPVGVLFIWFGNKKFKYVVIYSIISLLPPLLYYIASRFGVGEQSQYVSGIISLQILQGRVNYWSSLKNNLVNSLTFPILILTIAGFLKVLFTQRKSSIPIIFWGVISTLYILVICSAIPFDYYLVPVLPLAALLTADFLDTFPDILGVVSAILVIFLVVNISYLKLPPKYEWDPIYLFQANWLNKEISNFQGNSNQDYVIILSDAPPMTFYYLKRAGYRLITDDEQAWQDLQKLDGDYLVKLPKTSRGLGFWQKVSQEYKEVGPQIYTLK